MGRDRSWVVRITTAECAVELRCSAGGFCSVAFVIIPGLFEPPVRTLRATIPENESHIFR